MPTFCGRRARRSLIRVIPMFVLSLIAVLGASVGARAAGANSCAAQAGTYTLGVGLADDFSFAMTQGDQVVVAILSSTGEVGVGLAGPVTLDGDAVVGPASITFRADDTGQHLLSVENRNAAPSVRYSLSCSVPISCSDVDTACNSPARDVPTVTETRAEQTRLVQASASASAAHLSRTLSEARRARGQSGAQVGRLGLTLSTKGGAGDSGWTAWSHLGLTRFSGRTEGQSRALTFGLDYALSPQLSAGVLLSASTQSQTVAGRSLSGRAVDIGPYVIYALGEDLDLEAFATYGRPSYTVTGGRLTSTRITSGVKLHTRHSLPGALLHSHLSVRGFYEDTPAFGILVPSRRLDELVAAFGSRLELTELGAWRPSLGLGVDAIRARDGLGGTQSWVSPRGRLAIDYAKGATAFSASVEAGRAVQDSTDLSLQLSLSFRF